MTPKRRGKKIAKKLLTVLAPSSLGGVELLPIMVSDPELAVSRTYECLFYDVTEDVQHQTIKLKLRIVKVDGDKAFTVYAGHEYLREYLRSLIIRGTSYVDIIKDVVTKDGVKYRVRAGVFTVRRINTSRQKAIRKIAFEFLEKRASELDNDVFIKEMLFGKLSSDLLAKVKKICPIRHVGIVKVKLLSNPLQLAEKIYGSSSPHLKSVKT